MIPGGICSESPRAAATAKRPEPTVDANLEAGAAVDDGAIDTVVICLKLGMRC